MQSANANVKNKQPNDRTSCQRCYCSSAYSRNICAIFIFSRSRKDVQGDRNLAPPPCRRNRGGRKALEQGPGVERWGTVCPAPAVRLTARLDVDLHGIPSN